MITLPSVLIMEDYNLNWCFNNVTSHYIFYDIYNFDNHNNLSSGISPQDDITLVNGSVIFPKDIKKV